MSNEYEYLILEGRKEETVTKIVLVFCNHCCWYCDCMMIVAMHVWLCDMIQRNFIDVALLMVDYDKR